MTTATNGPKFLKKFRRFLKSSSIGGFMTIALRLLLLGYFLSNLVTVINRSQSAIVNSIYKKDLSFDETSFNLTKNEFDMALFISYFGTEEGVQDNIHRYFTAKFYQIFFEDNPYTWGTGNDWVYMPIGIEICKEGRFLGENRTAKLINITGNYLCPEENFNLKLSGGENLKCKTQEESEAILPYMNVFFSYITQYFDHNNYGPNPIINNIQNYYWPLNKYISNNQMMKYTQNIVNTADSWLTSNLFGDEFVYYTGRLEYTQIGTRDLDAGWSLFSVEIDMDEGYIKTGRTVMTILDAFSIVGGLMGIAFAFFQYFMETIQEKLFMSSIISKIFYQTNPDDKEEGVRQLNSLGSNTNSPIGTVRIKFMPKVSQQQSLIPQANPNSIISEKVLHFVKTLKTFKYGYSDLFCYKFRKLYCKILCAKGKIPNKLHIQNKLYQKARNTIENEFDIVRVIKTVRKVDLIFKTMFSKYQSFFIPILRNNVLSKNDIKLRDADFNVKEIQEIKKIDDNKLKIFISSLIMQSEKSKIDKRILKNLSDEYRQNVSQKKIDLENNKVGVQLKRNFLSNLAQKLDTNAQLKKYNLEDEWSF
ncbi:UNKNOWN [Stylonychia lemnae]|uniref:Uncharacterized protein n=1 Tax=Stylonychia lemnae TaxID=5949 RepID=A0A077ZS22_STYLE|nr:UNKNOWN [Stylonychia lemnae]|eukprot:CDW72160.1 UNKNOWN [Stylonychia lemnae]